LLICFKPTNVEEYRQKIKAWIDSVSTLGDKRSGYARERVTCYMHSAAYNIPQTVEQHKNLKQFSGQGQSKLMSRIWPTIERGKEKKKQSKTGKWNNGDIEQRDKNQKTGRTGKRPRIIINLEAF